MDIGDYPPRPLMPQRSFTIWQTAYATILAAIWVMVMSSCGGTADLLTASFIPATRAYVKVKQDRHDRYVIQVVLHHLIQQPEKQSARQTYVVWMVSECDGIYNLGALKVSSFLSPSAFKTTFRPGRYEKPVRIYITVEDDPDIIFPENGIVYSTSRFQD